MFYICWTNINNLKFKIMEIKIEKSNEENLLSKRGSFYLLEETGALVMCTNDSYGSTFEGVFIKSVVNLSSNRGKVHDKLDRKRFTELTSGYVITIKI